MLIFVPSTFATTETGYTAGAWIGAGLMLASLLLALAVARRTRAALP